MAVFTILTEDGKADAGQEEELKKLKAELAKPDAKVLLHLHGGLVNQKSGKDIADRLSGIGEKSWQLDSDWTQIYVVWRTGAFETFKTNWQELVDKDRLYLRITTKLICFFVRQFGGTCVAACGSTIEKTDTAQIEAEIFGSLTGKAESQLFEQFDTEVLSKNTPEQLAILMDKKDDDKLEIEFEKELEDDKEFQLVAEEIDKEITAEEINEPTPSSDQASCTTMCSRLDEDIQSELKNPSIKKTKKSTKKGTKFHWVVSGAKFVVKLAGKVGLLKQARKVILLKRVGMIVPKCVQRFRSGRHHGIHATIVEEVCRAFYGDRVGAALWGMMVQDAEDHFGPKGFGSTLVDLLGKNPPKNFVVTAHSAGSIWATHLLSAMKEKKMALGVKLFLLAPAVRTDLFKEMLDYASDMITRCRVFSMNDELERRAPVLGDKKRYIYPSSLLYLVSGLCEEKGKKKKKKKKVEYITSFFKQGDNKIISSPSPESNAASHGAFDDDPATLATISLLMEDSK